MDMHNTCMSLDKIVTCTSHVIIHLGHDSSLGLRRSTVLGRIRPWLVVRMDRMSNTPYGMES